MSPPLRIVKVGGSLLSRDDLGERLQRWLAGQPPGTNVLLAGGGSLADAVRDWDRRFGLGQAASHWLCVDLLDSTARVLHLLLRRANVECPLIRSLREFESTVPTAIVFGPARFLRDEEPALPGVKLPATWATTSDSIAARLAVVAGADELVLLKSSLPSAQLSDNYVDAHFPVAAQTLKRIRLVDLRSAGFPEQPLGTEFPLEK
jgi:aspartokinase-like uncharacterized kinase